MYHRVPCFNLDKDIEHSDQHVIGPFRFNVDFSLKLNNGLFFMGEVDDKTPSKSLKFAYAHKTYWDIFMEITKEAFSCRLNVAERNESLLSKMLFRFIPKNGNTYQNLLKKFDPSNPMDFEYGNLAGYEIFLLINEEVDDSRVRVFVNSFFDNLIIRNRRVVHGIVQNDFDMMQHSENGEGASRTNGKKRKAGNITKGENEFGKRLKEFSKYVKTNYALSAHPNSGSKDFRPPFNLQGNSESWSYVLDDIRDLKDKLSACFNISFDNIFDALERKIDDPEGGICFYNLCSPRRLNHEFRHLIQKDQLDDYLEINSEGKIVFSVNDESMWIEFEITPETVTDMTRMMCPYFYQTKEGIQNEMPFYLNPHHQETMSGNSMNKWSWCDRYAKEMLCKYQHDRFPTFSDDPIIIGMLEGTTFITTTDDITVENLHVHGVGKLWQWTDDSMKGTTGSFSETNCQFIHQLWLLINEEFLLRTYKSCFQEQISMKFVAVSQLTPLVEFPARRDDERIVLLPRGESREKIITKSIRSNFLVAWNSGTGMASSFLTAVKEMNSRFYLTGTQIDCPWFPKSSSQDSADMDDDDEIPLPSCGSLYKHNMDPFSNYIILLVNLFESFLDVQDHHSAMLHLFFTCMNTHKGTARRPHLIIWGGPAVSKSFLMNVATDLFCPGTVISRSHVSDQYIFGEAENRDTTNACRVYLIDEAKPSDIGIYKGEVPNQQRISMLKERLTRPHLVSHVLQINNQTSQRSPVEFDRSNENVQIFNTNFYPRSTDCALDSRFLRRHVPQIIRIDQRPKTNTEDQSSYTRISQFFQSFDYIRIQYEMLIYLNEVQPPFLYVFENLMSEFISRTIKDYPLAMNLRQDTRIKENARGLATKMVTSFAVFQSVFHKKSKFFSSKRITPELFLEIEKFMIFPSSMFPFVLDLTCDQYFNPMWLLALETIAGNDIYFEIDSATKKEHYNYGIASLPPSFTDLPWLWKETNEFWQSTPKGMRPRPQRADRMEQDVEDADEQQLHDKKMDRIYQRYVVIESTTAGWNNRNDFQLFNMAAAKICNALQGDKNAPSQEYIANALNDLTNHHISDKNDPENISHPAVMVCSGSAPGSSTLRSMLCVSKLALTLAHEKTQCIQSVLDDMRHKFTIPSQYLLARPCKIDYNDGRKTEKREVPQILDTWNVPDHSTDCSLLKSNDYLKKREENKKFRKIQHGFDMDLNMDCVKDIDSFVDSNGKICKCDCFRSRLPMRTSGRAIDSQDCEEMQNRMGFCPSFPKLEIFFEDALVDDKAFEDFFTEKLGYRKSKLYGEHGMVHKYHPIKSAPYWLDWNSKGFEESYPKAALDKWKYKLGISSDSTGSYSRGRVEPEMMSKNMHEDSSLGLPKKAILNMFRTFEEHQSFLKKLLQTQRTSTPTVGDLRRSCELMADVDPHVKNIFLSKKNAPASDIRNWIEKFR